MPGGFVVFMGHTTIHPDALRQVFVFLCMLILNGLHDQSLCEFGVTKQKGAGLPDKQRLVTARPARMGSGRLFIN